LIAGVPEEEVDGTIDNIVDEILRATFLLPARPERGDSQTQLSSERIRIDLAGVFDMNRAMSRSTGRSRPADLGDGNRALAQAILEAIKIKENAGLARNPFTGRVCYKLTDAEAARQATADENTAELVTLILETREPAFIHWAQKMAASSSGSRH
jgi:hypothetical protein